jgi:hypothetical protein
LALSNKKKIDSALRRFSASNRIELLRQFESIYKTALAHESGDPGVLFKEKTEGRTSRETVPLNGGYNLIHNPKSVR